MAYPYLAPGARLLAVNLKDSEGNALGKIKEWMMDVDAGRVVYVLAALEESDQKFVAIPWEAMLTDKENGGYRVKITNEQLINSPQISAEQIQDLPTNTEFLDQLFKQYGITPYWQGNEPTLQNLSAGAAPADTSPSSPKVKQEKSTSGEGQSQNNDLKEQKDEHAAATGDAREGRTHTEHGLASGYGAESPQDQGIP